MGFELLTCLWVLSCAVAMIGYGWPAAQRLAPDTNPALRLGLAYGIGTGLLVLALTATGFLGLWSLPLFLVLIVPGIGLAINAWRKSGKPLKRPSFHWQWRHLDLMLMGAVVATIIGVGFLAASAPAGYLDAIWHRLVIVDHYWETRSLATCWDAVPHALLPQYGEVALCLSYAVGGAAGTHFQVWTQFLAVLLLLGGIATHYWNPRAGLIAVFIYATHSITLEYIAAAMTDSMLVLALAMAIYLILQMPKLRARHPVWWYTVTALALGIAFGTKTNGIWFIGALLLLLAIRLPWRQVPLTFIKLGIPSLAIGCVWMLRNYAVTGNPVWPAAVGLFGNGPVATRMYDIAIADLLRSGPPGLSRTPGDMLAGLYYLTFNPQDRMYTSGILSPMLSSLGPLALVLAVRRTPRRNIWLLVLVAFVFGYFGLFLSQTRPRYLLPALALLGVAASVIYLWLRRHPIGWWICLVMVAGTTGVVALETAFYHAEPVLYTLNGDRDAYLQRRLNGRICHAPASLDLDKLDQYVPPDGRVLLLNKHTYYCSVPSVARARLYSAMEYQNLTWLEAAHHLGATHTYYASHDPPQTIIPEHAIQSVRQLEYGTLVTLAPPTAPSHIPAP